MGQLSFCEDSKLGALECTTPYVYPAPLHLELTSMRHGSVGPGGPRSDLGYARSCIRTSENTPSRRFVNKGLLVRLLALRGPVGAQPQRDVGRLHGLSHHRNQIVAQSVEVRLVPELSREGL